MWAPADTADTPAARPTSYGTCFRGLSIAAGTNADESHVLTQRLSPSPDAIGVSVTSRHTVSIYGHPNTWIGPHRMPDPPPTPENETYAASIVRAVGREDTVRMQGRGPLGSGVGRGEVGARDGAPFSPMIPIYLSTWHHNL